MTLAIVASALVGVAMFGGSVFLAQYFQIAQGYTPTKAGLMSLPMILGMMVASTIAGGLITKYGKWKVYLVVGSVLLPIGLALFGTIDAHTSKYMLWAFMIVLGVGIGLVMQNLVLAAQNDVPARELGAATSAVSFFRSMGGTIGVSVLGAILANKVTETLNPGGASVRRRRRGAERRRTTGAGPSRRRERVRRGDRGPVHDVGAVRGAGADRGPVHQGEATADHQRSRAPRSGGT